MRLIWIFQIFNCALHIIVAFLIKFNKIFYKELNKIN